MTLVLDPTVRVGDHVIAALCRVQVSRQGWRHGAVFAARKEPVAILFGLPGKVRTISVAGTPLSREEVDVLCPGAMAEFMVLME